MRLLSQISTGSKADFLYIMISLYDMRFWWRSHLPREAISILVSFFAVVFLCQNIRTVIVNPTVFYYFCAIWNWTLLLRKITTNSHWSSLFDGSSDWRFWPLPDVHIRFATLDSKFPFGWPAWYFLLFIGGMNDFLTPRCFESSRLRQHRSSLFSNKNTTGWRRQILVAYLPWQSSVFCRLVKCLIGHLYFVRTRTLGEILVSPV